MEHGVWRMEHNGSPHCGVEIFFNGELEDLLPETGKEKYITVESRGKRSVKDLVQSMGVPHTEVGGIRVNDAWVEFSYLLRDGDRVDVFPISPRAKTADNPLLHRCEPFKNPGFVCDVHLWKLARRLRLLGFDTRFNPGWDDADLADISQKERLILLTRDRGLLMRNKVTRGLLIRKTDPEKQVEEVLRRLEIDKNVRPFTRCLVCNGILEPAALEGEFFEKKLKAHIPPGVLEWCKEYHFCPSCEKVFWKGSHYEKLIGLVEKYLGELEGGRQCQPPCVRFVGNWHCLFPTFILFIQPLPVLNPSTGNREAGRTLRNPG